MIVMNEADVKVKAQQLACGVLELDTLPKAERGRVRAEADKLLIMKAVREKAAKQKTTKRRGKK